MDGFAQSPSPAGRSSSAANFTRVRAPGASGGGVVRHHLAALSLRTGRVMPWHPRANGTVTALRANAAATTIYVGGGVTTINGFSRAHRAALTTSRSALWRGHAKTNRTGYAIPVSPRR